MASLGKSIGGLTATLMGGRAPGLPPLPEGLGLPSKSTGIATYNEKRGNIATDAQYQAAQKQANAYNQALVNLLNQQPHLSGAERTEIYRYYGDDMANAQQPVYNNLKKKYGGLTDFTGQISQMTPEQYQQQQQQAAAAQAAPEPEQPTPAPYTPPLPPPQSVTPAPVTPPAQAVQAPPPQTVGPTPKPVEPPPPPTPVVATEGGNIAGKTTTTGGNEDTTGAKSRGRRGRVATLLTGLGGALERFGS